ncbi:MAG: hypothetical protein NZM15_04240 [Flavobacteriales bacterium]|nr:hypothetical protein [Flavobacteriales bacterium]MDW8431895.1 hypothetical protein [Flavobacteriales bacterium]
MRIAWLLFGILVYYSSKSQIVLEPCKYKQPEFDSDTCCWRKLSQKGSYDSAANLIVQYLSCTKKANNTHSLNWHAGQMFAFANSNSNAIHYFKKTYNIFTKWFGGEDGKSWYFYAKGSVAFLQGRKHRLKKIITKWNKKLPKDLNYKSLEKLYSEFGNSYKAILGK